MNYFQKRYRIVSQLLLLILIGCQSPDSISGRIENAPKDSKIYLIKPGNLRSVAAPYFGTVVDSASIFSNGDFNFSDMPEIKTSELFELAVQPQGKAPNYLKTENPLEANFMPIVLEPGSHVSIYSDWFQFQKRYSIKMPSKNNKALLKLRDINVQAFKTYLNNKNWHVEDGSELLAKEKALLNYQKALMNFANETKELLPALVALRWVSPENDYERVPEFLVEQCKSRKKNYPEHPWVKELCEMASPENLPVLVGSTFPNLKLPLISGDTLDIKTMMGKKLTIVDLWASWCAPCRKENREILVPLWDKYHDQGLNIIAYGLESDLSYWKTAAERDGADRWFQASDLQGDDADFLKKIRVQTIPANFILDAEGMVIAKNLHGKALEHLVNTYFE
ncbi:TlpA family protein disulfide reductase [Gaetbulibacter aestuarii]|uniref:TlpA disulfide reductase family protein n=1 Tax=Gaetbulibacter aestuarii TaxID=1502358 RepID=A0ABW7MY11_9FLAO